MPKLLLLLVTLLVLGSGCKSSRVLGQQIPDDLPPNVTFQRWEEVREFDIEASVRIVRDPEAPKHGIAAVKIHVTYKGDSVKSNMHAAVWLPDEVLRFSPMNVIGTNLYRQPYDLTPKQPTMGLLGTIRFENFEESSSIVEEAFQGTTRIKLIWDGGTSFIEFPGEKWAVEVVTQ